MNKISMPPLRNPNVSLTMHWPVFSSQECAQILAQANPRGWDKRIPMGPAEVPIFPDAEVNSNIERQKLPLGKNAFPLDQISFGVSQINSENWRFELTGFPADDLPWLVKQGKGKIKDDAWEVDLGPSFTSSRKLGFILQLSNPASYEGGDVVLHNVPTNAESMRAQGTLIVFPSYWLHRVTAVTKGHRHSIVGWIHGHNFR